MIRTDHSFSGHGSKKENFQKEEKDAPSLVKNLVVLAVKLGACETLPKTATEGHLMRNSATSH
jgi:hypothetical protein